MAALTLRLLASQVSALCPDDQVKSHSQKLTAQPSSVMDVKMRVSSLTFLEGLISMLWFEETGGFSGFLAGRNHCPSLVPRIVLNFERQMEGRRTLTFFFFFDCGRGAETLSRGLFFEVVGERRAFVMPAN
jgi:hypothetical protein